MAADLGKRLLAGVEEVRFDEILHCLRANTEPQDEHFGFPPLDRLIAAIDKPPLFKNELRCTFPVIELTSLAPGGGKTHLIYLLCARAVLPREFTGRQACAAILDTNGTFSVPRLAEQLQLQIKQIDDSIPEDDVNGYIFNALKHIHIFRPQSLDSTVATIDSLPEYLFNRARHYSFDRPVAFIAIDSASVFYWQDRAETEDAAFIASTSDTPAKPSGYQHLCRSITTVCHLLNCPAIITTWHLGSQPTAHPNGLSSRSLRPSLPSPWASFATLRLLVQRMPVRKFPPSMSVREALREAEDRWKAVEDGKFECVVNEWGLNEQTLRRVHDAGSSFEFRITDEGVVLFH